MINKVIENMDLKQICDSGQCFRWQKIDENTYDVVAFRRYLRIKQDGNEFSLNCSEEEWSSIWKDYFDLDTDYASIGANILISGDDYLKKAYECGKGIRILRQEDFETVISFLISQNNNIKRIRNSVEAICNKASIPVINEDGCVRYAFPGPEDVDEEFFNDKTLGLGYRDGYLRDMYSYTKSNPNWISEIHKLNHQDAVKKLKEFKGIGEKVANCISLFTLHNVNAFPVDTHIKQILETYYRDGFDYERYDGYLGIVQQYMFNYKING